MEHAHYMHIKSLISMWDADMKEDNYVMSDRVKWAFGQLFKEMNSQQRWDTIDGNHHITNVLQEAKLIDEQYKPLFETIEEKEA